MPIVPVKVELDVLSIQVPSLFFYEYLEEQYIDLLSKTLRKELGPKAKLEYSVVMDNTHLDNKQPYTLNIPTSNKGDLRNRPFNVGNQEKPTVCNPFVIPGIKKLNIVITSYSIHYTKLYEITIEDLLFTHNKTCGMGKSFG